MANKKFYRQGDILFEKISDYSSTEFTELQKLDTKTVALGELTGHHHSFKKNDQVLLFKKPEEELPSLVTVFDGTSTLTHQEHKPIQFEKGVYKITREQSYNPFLKNIQRSRD